MLILEKHQQVQIQYHCNWIICSVCYRCSSNVPQFTHGIWLSGLTALIESLKFPCRQVCNVDEKCFKIRTKDGIVFDIGTGIYALIIAEGFISSETHADWKFQINFDNPFPKIQLLTQKNHNCFENKNKFIPLYSGVNARHPIKSTIHFQKQPSSENIQNPKAPQQQVATAL